MLFQGTTPQKYLLVAGDGLLRAYSAGQLTDYYILRAVVNNEPMTNKENGACYERFRRQSSLSSLQPTKNNLSLSGSLAKLKNINPMEEVQNLSIQLDHFSKRPLSSRNGADLPLKKSSSSTSLKDVIEPISLKRQFSTYLTEQAALKKLDRIQVKPNTPQSTRHKFNNSAVFNQFHIIEEDSYINEEENVIEPVTFKACSNLKLNDKKQVSCNNGLEKLKQANRQSGFGPKQQLNCKKDKLKHDISQVDKMQKQLDLKRISREQDTPKLNQSINSSTKRTRQLVVKETAKGPKKPIHLDLRPLSDHHILSHRSPKNQVVLAHQVHEVTKKQESKREPLSDEKSQRIAANRLLTAEQKIVLGEKIGNLRDYVDKNEICSNGLDAITTYISRIQQLLKQ